jgi:hypothetical protein
MIGNRSSQKKILSVDEIPEAYQAHCAACHRDGVTDLKRATREGTNPGFMRGFGGCAIEPGLSSMRHGSRGDCGKLREWQGCKPRLIIERRDPSRTRNICSSLETPCVTCTLICTWPLPLEQGRCRMFLSSTACCMHDVGPVSNPRHTLIPKVAAPSCNENIHLHQLHFLFAP